ncbi:mannosyltransferase [Lignoscripta atroalba]|nr:mannosyltransferase [Lignoscripta atroalba]
MPYDPTVSTADGASNASRSSAASAKSQRRPPKQFLVPPIIAFYIFAFINIIAAAYAPIQDCDEVFNYWEPTHYLNRGYGLQTWEYSPEFSIRSWLYIAIHAIVGKLSSLLSATKTCEFYFIRTVLALVCAICESHFFIAISKTLNPRIGIMFMIIMLSSPGMFHASVAYLPSSFSMYTSMLGASAFMDWRGGSKTALGIMWFGLGAIVGWPFSAALITPFIAEELLLASITREGIEVVRRFIDGTVRSSLILALQVAVDAFFYHKIIVVPWRIVAYNIFSGSGRGPDIFGTEPWDFYIRNLLLNFNVWFLFAMSAGPILMLQYLLRAQSTTKYTLMRSVFFISPFYLWLLIFSSQAHKEERFIYPAYPFLGLNAAIALHTVLSYIGSSDPRTFISKVPAKVKFVIVSMSVILAIDAGILRTVGLVSAYRAPLQIYGALQRPGLAKPGETVCLGKEWHRFPSSYFLPNGMRAKFITSAFDGLLPGEFNEAKVGFGFFAGTWLIPPGMNDKNIADSGKYINIAHCSFLVDSYFPDTNVSAVEPNYILEKDKSVRPYLVDPKFKLHPATDAQKMGTLLLVTAAKSLIASSISTLCVALSNMLTLLHTVRLCLLDCARDLTAHPKLMLYAALLVIVVLFSTITIVGRIKKPNFGRANSPDLEKPRSTTSGNSKVAERPPGEWNPVDFKRPAAEPYADWDVHKTDPLPYRPFKHGPYHITMGLRTMKWDEWIELDNHYSKFHADKARRIQQRGSKCCKTAPEAFDGAVELLEEFCDYLPQRYPSLYQKTLVGMDNILTGESFNIVQRPLAEDPMQMAARMVQDDLAIMFEKPDGQYYLLAGAILLAGFWRLEDKFGMPLSEIHTSGDVPGFKQKLEKGMTNFFRRVQPNGPVLRNNYFIQVDDDLAWSQSIGNEDSEGIGWFTAEKNKAIEHHWFRSERQSLRRLPRSGGVVFTIRTYFHPITEIAKQPYVPGRLASAVRSWGDDVGRYKGRERYQDVLLEYLDAKHAEQVEGGLDLEKEDESRNFPF